jgi:hypothetical protein
MVRAGEEVIWGEAKGRIGVRLDLSRIEGGEASVRNSSPRQVGDWRYASSLTHLTSSPSNTNSLDSIFSIDFYKLSFY